MEKADWNDWWPRWVWVGECFFWYRLTRVVPDKFHRAVKRLCCVCVCSGKETIKWALLSYIREKMGVTVKHTWKLFYRTIMSQLMSAGIPLKNCKILSKLLMPACPWWMMATGTISWRDARALVNSKIYTVSVLLPCLTGLLFESLSSLVWSLRRPPKAHLQTWSKNITN